MVHIEKLYVCNIIFVQFFMFERPASILALDFVIFIFNSFEILIEGLLNFVIDVLLFRLYLRCAAEESAVGNIKAWCLPYAKLLSYALVITTAARQRSTQCGQASCSNPGMLLWGPGWTWLSSFNFALNSWLKYFPFFSTAKPRIVVSVTLQSADKHYGCQRELNGGRWFPGRTYLQGIKVAK